MKSLSAVGLILILLVSTSGCVVSEDFVYRSMKDLRAIADNLDQVQSVAEGGDLAGALALMDNATAHLDNIDAAINEAEKMGESPETISRVRSTSLYVRGILTYLRQSIDLLKTITEAKASLETMSSGTKETALAAVALIDSIEARIGEMGGTVDSMRGAEVKMNPDDSKQIGAKSGLESLESVQEKYEKLLPQLQTQRGAIRGLYGLE